VKIRQAFFYDGELDKPLFSNEFDGPLASVIVPAIGDYVSVELEDVPKASGEVIRRAFTYRGQFGIENAKDALTLVTFILRKTYDI